jgi:hypothetical protein
VSRFASGNARGWLGNAVRQQPVLARTDSNSQRFLAMTDSSSHAIVPHKQMIQIHHLEHALSAFGMHFAVQDSYET